MRCSCCGGEIDPEIPYFDYQSRRLIYRNQMSAPLYPATYTVFVKLWAKKDRFIKLLTNNPNTQVSFLRKAIKPLGLVVENNWNFEYRITEAPKP